MKLTVDIHIELVYNTYIKSKKEIHYDKICTV